MPFREYGFFILEYLKSDMSKSDRKHIKDILDKSLDLQALTLKEVSALIGLDDREIWEEVFNAANRVKEKVYGKRVVLFAPLYLSNECMNDCLYCGFRTGNKEARRKSLTVDEAVQEAEFLSKKGYRRLLLVASEHTKLTGVDYFEKIADAVYKNTDIRILHANTAPMSVQDFKRLKASGIGVYQCFQETYHIPSYRYLHPTGTKADYASRLSVMDRAIEAGFEDVGMGVLLGLYDWRWEVGALIAHSRRLMNKYGFGPHTLSVPRLQPAEGAEIDFDTYRVSDEDLKKIVAVYRLALPYVGVVISTRESADMREQLLLAGASQISAGSKTSPWGYMEQGDTEQFEIGDSRSLEEVMVKLSDMGMIPSLCTACYREGRSGEQFRHLAQNEKMKKFCHDNALLSLKEYIEDCCSDDVKEKMEKMLRNEISKSSNGLIDKMKLVEQGKRDVHS